MTLFAEQFEPNISRPAPNLRRCSTTLRFLNLFAARTASLIQRVDGEVISHPIVQAVDGNRRPTAENLIAVVEFVRRNSETNDISVRTSRPGPLQSHTSLILWIPYGVQIP